MTCPPPPDPTPSSVPRGAGAPASPSTGIRKLDLSGLDWVETEEEEEELVEAFRDTRAFRNALDRLELPFEAGEYIREELTEARVAVHRFAS